LRRPLAALLHWPACSANNKEKTCRESKQLRPWALQEAALLPVARPLVQVLPARPAQEQQVLRVLAPPAPPVRLVLARSGPVLPEQARWVQVLRALECSVLALPAARWPALARRRPMLRWLPMVRAWPVKASGPACWRRKAQAQLHLAR